MTKVNYPLLAVGGLLLVGLVVLLVNGFKFDPHEVPSVLENKPAPAFTMTDLDGNTWSLADLRGQVVVVNFWATWCVPCKQEYDTLQRAPAKWPDVKFFGVVYADEPDKVEAFLKLERTPPGYPNLIDPNGRSSIDYGVAGVPETYFIDEDGFIRLKVSFPVDDRLLTQVLGPPKAGS